MVAKKTATLGTGSGGSFQFSRLHAGHSTERTIAFSMESGKSSDSREIVDAGELRLHVSREGELRWEQGK